MAWRGVACPVCGLVAVLTQGAEERQAEGDPGAAAAGEGLARVT